MKHNQTAHILEPTYYETMRGHKTKNPFRDLTEARCHLGVGHLLFEMFTPRKVNKKVDISHIYVGGALGLSICKKY